MVNTRKKTKGQLAEERKKLEKLEKIPEENERVRVFKCCPKKRCTFFVFQTIGEYQAKEEELNRKLQKLEEDRMKLLESTQAETQPLLIKRERLQVELTEVKRKSDEAKAAVSVIYN